MLLDLQSPYLICVDTVTPIVKIGIVLSYC